MKQKGLFGVFMLVTLILCDYGQLAVASDSGLWQTDYAAALKQAAAENKHVLVDFSGSDWCGWCIKLDEEVFSKPEFIEYAKAKLICVLLDFPNSKPQTDEVKAQNKQLAEKYRIQGFPTVLILDPQGKLVKQTGYQRGGAAPYIEMIKSILPKDLHFVKYAPPQIVDYAFNADLNTGYVSIDVVGDTIAAREQVIRKIGEICSSKNVTHVAGAENLRSEGHYQILDEQLTNNILTIHFKAVY